MKVKGNALKPQNHGGEDAFLYMPIRVVGGLKMQDLQPVPLMTRTPHIGQILTIAQYATA